MSPDYDVIVLGGGAAGEHCASALAERGLRMALVERGRAEIDVQAALISTTHERNSAAE